MADKPTTPAKPKERRATTRARRHAELQTEYNEKMHRLAMLRRRIELAQTGVRCYEIGKISEAVRNFHSYLRILEDWKQVGEGKLMPSHFDKKEDVAELLLISGVYWDLTKLYDRTAGERKRGEFQHYLQKYILFSKDMPFEHVCLETLRKYLNNNKARHKAEFKNAYKVMGGSNCFVATALLDVCAEETLPRLREFRDLRLAHSRSGRAFIAWYYRNGPKLATLTDYAPEWLRVAMGKAIDGLARLTLRR
jgi:hypothetical protein